jgi:hypothetical protein
MPAADRLEPGKPWAAADHVVFRMDLEPQTLCCAVVRGLVVIGFEAQTGAHVR